MQIMKTNKKNKVDHSLNTQNIKRWPLFLPFFNFLAFSFLCLALQNCSSRGMEISRQIPELHPEYSKTIDSDSPYFLAEGGNLENLDLEQKNRLARLQENSINRSIASTPTRAPSSLIIQSGHQVKSSLSPSKGAFLLSEPDYQYRYTRAP